MLYVSRMVDRSHVCVTDSDDGVEDILNANELITYTRDLGIEIKGVSIFKKPRSGRWCVSASVYQPENTISAMQTKHKVLNGVDVKTDGTRIMSIQWSAPRDDRQVTIRLSDFGTSCVDYVFWWKGICANKNLTIILDDSVSVTKKSFKYLSIIGVKFDLCEVKNDKLAEVVYKAYMTTHNNRCVSGDKLPLYVIDDEVRLRYWQAVWFLEHDPIQWPERNIVFADSRIADKIYRKFGKEFKAISECSFYLNETNSVSERSHYMNRWYFDINIERDDDFEYMRSKCTPALFDVLAKYTTCNSGVVTRFRNYVRYFSVPEDIQQAFLKFVNRAHEFLYQLYLEDC